MMSSRRRGLDFREGMVTRRLKRVDKVLLVLSGKGGVGKSVVSATLAALLAKNGRAVGLMDADVHGPSSALLLGARGQPGEGRSGLTPLVSAGVKVMSIDFFAPGRPIPLTGEEARQVILEMLALTDWGDLDYLVVDMPPATGDVMMTLTSLAKEDASALVVTMPDRLSLAVARRVLQLLQSGKVPVVGVLGNMHGRGRPPGMSDDDGPRRLAEEFGVRFLGKLPYDNGVQGAVERGDIGILLGSNFGKALRRSMGVRSLRQRA